MRRLAPVLTVVTLAALVSWIAPAARAAEPIKIGLSMELTGPFAVIGKTGLWFRTIEGDIAFGPDSITEARK